MIAASTRRSWRCGLSLLSVVCVVACTDAAPARTQQVLRDSIPPTSFAELSAQLSEPGGYFDTDNLISNETSYLHAIDDLRASPVRGGAYLGVGPGQNFSYIAQIQPDIAFIVDIRRDNVLQHLLYKALFAMSPRRLDFLGALVGRDVSWADANAENWSIEEIVEAVQRSEQPAGLVTTLLATVREYVGTYGMPLSEADLNTIERFHRAFIEQGLSLRFNSFGRAPQSYYPTMRDLLLERDRSGNQVSYLARERDFQFVKELQRRNLVVPVVGDLSGPHAVRAIGEWLDERGVFVSAFYTSNVEFYLWGNGGFARFAANVAALPQRENSVLIRSYFGRRYRSHPQAVRGYASTQLTQSMSEFVAAWREGRYRTYFDIVWTR